MWIKELVDLYQNELNVKYEELFQYNLITIDDLGFISYHISQDISTIFIIVLAVKKEAQNKGIASQLINKLKEKNKIIMVAADINNLPANKLYIKHGFSDMGQVADPSGRQYNIYCYN